MMRLFWIREEPTPTVNGSFNAMHPWRLPGTKCDACGVTRGGQDTGVQHKRARLGDIANDGRIVRRFPKGNRQLQVEPEYEAAQGCPEGTAIRLP